MPRVTKPMTPATASILKPAAAPAPLEGAEEEEAPDAAVPEPEAVDDAPPDALAVMDPDPVIDPVMEPALEDELPLVPVAPPRPASEYPILVQLAPDATW